MSERSVVTSTLLGEDTGAPVRRTVLPGGLRVVTESVPTVRSVAIGVWVGVGSVDESPEEAGSTHYLEHLLFKGTSRRSALDISSAIESVGGDINAFTAKEYTCYYVRVLDADLPLAVDVVADMLTSSLIEQSEVDAERNVVLEEIAMRDDDPTDAIHDLMTERMWGDTPLGRPILGTVDSITGMARETVNGYYRRHYRPRNIVVAAAGNLDHDAVVKLVAEAFAAGGFLAGDEEPAAPRIGGAAPDVNTGVALLQRPTEQANLLLGMPGITRNDPRRFALGVLNAALGGGMSSRLFQEIRERRGLAYSVYSFAAQHAATGMFGVYVGCQPKKAGEVLDLARGVLGEVAASGITEDELASGKGQVRGGLVLGMEDTSARMSRLAKAELVYDELPSIDELLARIDAVTMDDVRELASSLLNAPPALAVVGPFDDPSRFESALH
ncbi:M16 family metallopeptidase [Phytoactinopolyspora halotolerans]|uniref:Insulinase family protein n=1 Tax=Phytoactinopolyspora halotolerans TaxID=1981512 RepID=A0A6L9S5M3_9ACTN|nr:pitrilysin family protein [Phytoactinopolyspora halotolerans]NEE00041.1 insulinase family protein [Phytoactinopolyspora halotolerans]